MRRRRRISSLAAAVIFLVILIPALYLGFTKHVPFVHHYTIRGAFRTANEIKPGSPVRIAGVNVGKVSKVTLIPGGHGGAYVYMQLSGQALPIHANATAKIRPRIFLEGNFFVDLQPGTPNAPAIKDGGTIPIQNTSGPVQLDQVLSALPSDTRSNLQTLLEQYGKAVKEGGPAFDRSIPYWKQAYESTAQANQAALGEHPHDLSRLIDTGGSAAAALNQHPQQLSDLVHNLDVTMAAFASQSTNLSAAVAELPRTLSVGRPALAALDRALPPTRQLSNALRPGVRSTGPMIDASLPWIQQVRLLVSEPELRGLTADLRPTVPALAKLNAETIPLLGQVRAASSCQDNVIIPWSHDHVPNVEGFPFKYDLNVYQEAVKYLPGISSESTSGDANGQWFRVLGGGGVDTYALGNGEFGNTIVPVQGIVPPLPAYRPPIRPSTPCETQQTPDLRSNKAAPPPFAPGTQPSGPGGLPLPSVSLFKAQAAQAAKELQKEVDRQHLPIKVSSKVIGMGGGK